MGDLEALGLDHVEERVYEALVRQPHARPAEVARVAAVSARSARLALQALAEKGLAVASSAEAGSYSVAPPEEAIGALIEARKDALARARGRATALAAQSARVVTLQHPGDLVGVVIGAEAVYLQFQQIQFAAREEILTLDRPPYPRSGGVTTSTALDARNPGVRYRTIYERSILEDPAIAARVEAEIAHGEIGRVLNGIPIKLGIGDRALAMLPLTDADSPGGQSALVIRPSVLLDSLVALFETLWEKAMPLHAAGSPRPAGAEDPEVVRTARLMAAGLKDAAMARHLGVTERTVRRRVAAVLAALNVESRFQAGIRAREVGWV